MKANVKLSAVALLLAALVGGPWGCAGPAAQGDDLLRAGRVDEAVARLGAAAAGSPDDPEIRAVYGVALRRAGRPEEAEAQLRAALGLNPAHRRARQELLGLLVEEERLVPAVSVARELRRVAPDAPEIQPEPYQALLERAGRRALDEQHLLSAIGIFGELLEARPDRSAELSPLLAAALGARARQLAEEERGDEALRAVDQALALDPPGPELRRLKAELLLASGAPEEAAAEYQRAVQSAGDPAAEARGAALALRKAERFEDSSRLLAQSVKAAGERVRPQDLLTLAELYLQLELVGRAGDALERYVELKGGGPAPLGEAAGLAEKANAGELARRLRAAAATAAPNDYAPAQAYADLLLRQGRREEALQAIEAFRAAAPADQGHFAVAQWYQEHAESELAVAAYKAALAATPKRSLIHLRLAELHRAARRPAQRTQSLRTYVRVAEDKVAAHRKVASIHAEAGEIEPAIASLKAALAVQPKDRSLFLDQARIYEGAKRPIDEAAAWRQYVLASPDAVSAARDVAVRYRDRGDLDRAVAFVELGIERSAGGPARQELLLLLLDVQRRSDERSGLAATLERLLQAGGSDEQRVVLLRRAQRLLAEARDPRLGLMVVEALLELQPDDPELYLEQGTLHLGQRALGSAAGAFERYEAKAPDKVAALSKVARAYGQAHRAEQALQALDRMIELGGDDPRVLAQAVDLRLEQGAGDDAGTGALLDRLLATAPPREVELLPLARRLQDHHLFPHAEQVFRYADLRQPLGGEELMGLGRVLLSQRKTEAAREILARVEATLRRVPLARARLEWGQACVELGLAAEALEVYRKVLTAGHGPLHQAFVLAVDALRQSGDREAMASLATLYAAKAAPPEEVHAAIGRAWEVFGDDEQALRSFQTVLQHEPGSREALEQVASILLRNGRGAEAAEIVRRQIREAGDTPEAWLEVAHRYARWGAYADALEFYDMALERGADVPIAQAERGTLLLALGRREPGRAAFRAALAAARGEKQATLMLRAGQAYVSVGWDEEAIDVFQRALAVDHNTPRTYAILVELYLRSGKLAAARRVLATARAHGMNRLFSVGLAFEEAGYHQQALSIYQQILEQGVEGQAVQAFWRLGLDRIDRGEADRLAPLADRFLATVRSSFDGQWLVALLYTRAGRSDLALQHLQAGAESSDNPRRWLLVADAALRCDEDGQAVEALLQHVADAGRHSGSAVDDVLGLLALRGAPRLAGPLLDRLRASHLSAGEHALAVARLHLDAGRLQRGMAAMDDALAAAREGELPTLRRQAAEAAAQVRLLPEAEELLLGGRAPSELDKQGLQLLVELHTRRGDAAALRKTIAAFLAASPVDESQDRITVGAILRSEGANEAAVAQLERAMEVASSPEQRRLALYHLLACLHALGNAAAIDREVQTYIDRSPAPMVATEAALAELRKLNLWAAAGRTLRRQGVLQRGERRLLGQELTVRLALGDDQGTRRAVQALLRHAFSEPGNHRDRDEVLRGLATKLGWAMREDLAREQWDEILEMAPARFAPLERLLLLALDTHDAEGFAQSQRRFLASAGERPATWRWLVRRLVQRGRGADAKEAAAQLVQAAPGDLRNQLGRLAAALQAGDAATARAATEQALQVADDEPLVRVKLGTLWLQGGYPLASIDDEGDWGAAGVSAEWQREAERLVTPACAPSPAGHAAAWLVRGLAGLRLGDVAGARSDLAHFMKQGGGYTAARLEPFPAPERDEPEVQRLAELVWERLGTVSGPEARLLLVADAYLAAGRPDDARALLERGLREATNPRDLLARLVRRAAHHEQHALGLELLEELNRRFPDNAWEVTMLAELLEQQQGVELAAQAYQRGIERDPQEAVYYNNLAYLYARAGVHLEEALQLVQRARRLGPQGARYYLDTEGWVLHRLGRHAEARERLREAVLLMDKGMGTSVSESLYHLGAVEAALGNEAAARAAFQRAAAIDPRGEYGLKAAAALREATPKR